MAVEGWGEKEVFTKGVCDSQKEGEGRRWAKEIMLGQGYILWGNSFAHRQSFCLVGLALPVNHKPNRKMMVTSVKSEIFNFSLYQTAPWILKRLIFLVGRGGAQGTTEHSPIIIMNI